MSEFRRMFQLKLPILFALSVVIFSSACTLTTTPPTPTAQPTPVPLLLPTTPPLAIGVVTATPIITTGTTGTGIGTGSTCPLTPPTWVAYSVQPGDSLGALAVAVDTPVADLVTNNCLNNADTLFADQVIYLPRLP